MRRGGRGARVQSRADELPIFSSYYDLFLWAFERSDGFPRVLRPSLTGRFLALLLQGLEQLLELRYTRERASLFRQVNMTFEKLRVLSRALKDRRALSIAQWEHFNRSLDDVGRQLGGWKKALDRRAAQRSAV